MIDHRISDIENINEPGRNGFMVHLVRGFHLANAHVFPAKTREEIRRKLKRVKRCECALCARKTT